MKIAVFALAVSAALIAPTAAHADNIDFGTDQASCQAAERQLIAGGNTSADCFQTGPGHYSLTYSRQQIPSYNPAYAPPTVLPSNDYISLAVAPSVSTTQAGMGRAPTAMGADQIALAKCAEGTSTPCQVIVRAFRACTALARTPGNDIVGVAGPDPPAAAAAASNAAPGGMVVGTWCTDRLGG